MNTLRIIVAFVAAIPFVQVGLCAETDTWWSRKPLVAPKLPPENPWTRNEIDRFILAKLKANDLRP